MSKMAHAASTYGRAAHEVAGQIQESKDEAIEKVSQNQVFQRAMSSDFSTELGQMREAVVGRDLQNLILSVVVIALLGAMGIIGLTELNDATNNTEASNYLKDAVAGIGTLGDFIQVLMIFGIIGALFTLVYAVVARARGGGMMRQ